MTSTPKQSIGTGWAAGFAAAYGTLALVWTGTGRGYPFGAADSGREMSALRAVPAEAGAPIFAGVLLLAALAFLIMHGRDTAPRPARIALLTYAWAVTAALLIVLPDTRALTLAGYTPILIIGFPFGYPPVDYGDVFTWTVANQAIAIAGGLLLARATLRWQFRTAGACVRCGRDGCAAGWTSPAAAARWGRWATWTAAVIPLFYAVIRLGWAVGLPIGISPEFLAEMRASGLVWAGAGLGGFALVGAILTLGLMQRWGEVFPRWMVGLAGRRVPIKLATVPASLVAVFILAACTGILSDGGFVTMFAGGVSLATLPMITWPLWGVALGAATVAYYLRRRGVCRECGRGGGAPVGDAAEGLVRRETADAY